MKYTRQTSIIAIVGVLFFTACGGSNEKTIINEDLMIKGCPTGEFTPLNKGDKVTVLEDGTEIDLRHKQDGTKKACVLRGSAKVN